MGKIEAAKVAKNSVKMRKYESVKMRRPGDKSLGLHTFKSGDYSPALFRK
jgi:hypothetical protein